MEISDAVGHLTKEAKSFTGCARMGPAEGQIEHRCGYAIYVCGLWGTGLD